MFIQKLYKISWFYQICAYFFCLIQKYFLNLQNYIMNISCTQTNLN